MAAPVHAETRRYITGRRIFGAPVVQTAPKPKVFLGAGAFDTDWMGGKCPFFANRVLLVMCAGTTRFARDFRNLGSQWDPSDVGKRMEQENCVVCRTALPTAVVVRAVRALWPLLGSDAGIFASGPPTPQSPRTTSESQGAPWAAFWTSLNSRARASGRNIDGRQSARFA